MAAYKHILSLDRKVNGKGRSFPRLASNHYFPLITFHDFMHDGEAQSRTLSLGSKERIEDPADFSFSNSRPGVADLNFTLHGLSGNFPRRPPAKLDPQFSPI